VDAVIFPGQGSQKPGMGSPWAATASWSVIKTVSEILKTDVAALLLDADAPTLQATHNAQVAAFALGLVLLDAAAASGLRWDAAAGHSLGEYTALVAAGVLSIEDATQLVGERAKAMQRAADADPGTMRAIIGLDLDAVEGCCEAADGSAWVANDNAPGQVVVAGTHDGLAAAAAAAKDRGGKVLELSVGGAFHSPLMRPAQEGLDLALGKAPFADARVPVVANVDAQAHQARQEWRPLLSAQLCSRVRWRESVLRLADLGVSRVVELGPGGVLSGMVKRITPDLQRVAVGTPAELDDATR
jgi:[acyl-carrier-protein] S-malonyltransferase